MHMVIFLSIYLCIHIIIVFTISIISDFGFLIHTNPSSSYNPLLIGYKILNKHVKFSKTFLEIVYFCVYAKYYANTYINFDNFPCSTFELINEDNIMFYIIFFNLCSIQL